MTAMSGIELGNADDEGRARGGWFLGHFIPSGLRMTHDVEVKWGSHAAGERRETWGVNRRATTLSILVRGRFRITFPDREVVLEREGDYALWAPGIPHTWCAEEPSTIVTVRWPSFAGDGDGTESSDQSTTAEQP
jgi:hypothetical protein